MLLDSEYTQLNNIYKPVDDKDAQVLGGFIKYLSQRLFSDEDKFTFDKLIERLDRMHHLELQKHSLDYTEKLVVKKRDAEFEKQNAKDVENEQE